jgi:hypothetical protein
MSPLLQVHTDAIAGTLKGLESGIKSPLSKAASKKAVSEDTKIAVVQDKEVVVEEKDQRRRDIVSEVSPEKRVVEMKRIDDGNDDTDDVATKVKTSTYWSSNKAKEKEGVLKLVERVKQRRLSMKVPEEAKGAVDDADSSKMDVSSNNDNNDNNGYNNNDGNDNNAIGKEDSIRWESNPLNKEEVEETGQRKLFTKDDTTRILKALDMETDTTRILKALEMETTTSIIITIIIIIIIITIIITVIIIIIIIIISVDTTTTNHHHHHHTYYQTQT